MSNHHESGTDVHDTTRTDDARSRREPIAIVGMGCRFPGQACTPYQFWCNLRDGVDAITEIPGDRWNREQFHEPAQGVPGKAHACRGGFVDHLDQFDPQFFGISPREAARMDPQQRMLLEVTWEAIEDAGVRWDQVAGSRTSVHVGISSWDFAYLGLSYEDRGVINAYSNTGGSLSIASNRISYCFDLRGPSASIDTACSSALVSLHQACQSIWNDGCPMALAGGVNALLMPDSYIAFSQLGMLSPDGRCKAFDARANGFVRGEGAGMVLLKPLSRAVADNDRVYAVIRSTAVNQDGRTPGMTVPRQQSQECLLRSACARAGIESRSIQYVEAHGTGTQVGDPIETRALGNALAGDRPDDQPCMIGSVKTNIGHLEAAAGIASVIKVALSLYHDQIPGNLHFERPNPEIDFAKLKLRVPIECEPWPDHGAARLAGINGFGYGGTNAHLILEGRDIAPGSPRNQAASVSTRGVSHQGSRSHSDGNGRATEDGSANTPVVQPFPVSARCRGALKAAAGKMQQFIDGSAADIGLRELAGHAAHRRSHHDHRLVVIAESKEQLSQQLAAFSEDRPAADAIVNRCLTNYSPEPTFVCSGQGPQWWAMGRQLLETEPVFRSTVQRCDEISRQLGSWSLLEALLADESASRLQSTAIAQPAIFAIQVALGALWRSWGVVPARVVGHSVGEIAATHLAGVYSLEEAFRIAYHRGRCMDLAPPRGRMLAVGLSRDEAEPLVASFGDDVTIAAVNGPSSITLSGAAEPLRHIATLLEERDIFVRQLKVEYAFHSAQMEPAREELLRSLDDLQPAEAAIPLVSTVTGDWVRGPELNAEYWWLNVRRRVRFADAMSRIAKTSSDVVVELSPHPVLAYSITECFQQADKAVRVLCSLKRKEPERATMLRSLAELHTIGVPIDWRGVVSVPGSFLRLPSYPWQRQRCWFESAEARRTRLAAPVHPLLGVSQGGPRAGWQCRLDVNHLTYLADHCVQGLMMFPAAGYVEMALAAATAISGESGCRVSRLNLANPCILSSDEPRWMETEVLAEDRGLGIYSRPANETGNWILHATAEYSTQSPPAAADSFSSAEARRRCSHYFDRKSCYDHISKLGLHYGPAFQGVVEGWRRDGEALGIVEIPPVVADQQEKYLVHPALLDACFHVVIPADAEFQKEPTRLYLPLEIERLVLHRRAGKRLVCHARLLRKTSERMVADLDLYDEQGNLVLEVRGLTSQYVNGSRSDEKLDDLLYHYAWQSNPRRESGDGEAATAVPPAENHGRWIVFADRTGVGEALIDRLRAEGHEVAAVMPGQCFSSDSAGAFQIAPGNREDMFRLMRSVLANPASGCQGIVHLWNLDAPQDEGLPTETLEAAQDQGVLSVLHLVQAWDAAAAGERSTRLFLVTRGAQSVGECPERTAPAQSPAIGLGRVIGSEYPKFQCELIDLDPSGETPPVDELFGELQAGDQEDEVAFRARERFVHRFVPMAGQKQEVPGGQRELPYRLDLHSGGTIEDLALRTSVRRAPEAGEVEIAVAAAALNFSDVMKVLGLYPGLADGPVPLGAECAGTITRVGREVTEFAPGDEVIAVAPWAFGSHAVVQSRLVAAKPGHLSFEEAATIPIAFLTAAFALERLARIEPDEQVLIHSASGGVGLAAVQLAREAGAKILATAGTDEKRQFLRRQGIECVMNSRSLEFADQVMQWTAGRGVDVILNSLAGEAIPRGMETLAPGGRFLEIGKRDIHQNTRLGLLPFRNNLSFFAIDLDQLMRESPDRIGRLLRDLASRFSSQKLAPLPRQTFEIGKIKEAFRFMQQGKHIGKIVVSMENRPSNVEWGECESVGFNADATYLIVGGLGGFGLALARWMVERGARYLALSGRRGADTPAAQQAVQKLQSMGAHVHVLKGDVAKPDDVQGMLNSIQRSLPPLRGVFHAAMVLEDGLLLNLDRDWMHRVMAPKVSGAWNLHTLTQGRDLDYFVLFSSLSSVFGHAGQGNYAAANAFLDALTHYRRAEGLPCLTVNWGYLGDVGYLSERRELGERLERQGVVSFTIREGLDALERLLQRQAIQVSVMRVDWSRWRGLGVTGVVSPRFAHLLPRQGRADGEVAGELPTADAVRNATCTERPRLVDRLLRDKIAKLLGGAPEQLDGDVPLLDLGLDSLMAVELSNWIESQLRIDVPVVQLMRSPGLAQLGKTLCDGLAQAPGGSSPSEAEAEEDTISNLLADPQQLLTNIDDMSSSKVDQLLTTLLQEDNGRARVHE
ncbi:MAG: SDR family NAD(P)-dependent oxidoreductase [Planctomycetota bacterium]